MSGSVEFPKPRDIKSFRELKENLRNWFDPYKRNSIATHIGFSLLREAQRWDESFYTVSGDDQATESVLRQGWAVIESVLIDNGIFSKAIDMAIAGKPISAEVILSREGHSISKSDDAILAAAHIMAALKSGAISEKNKKASIAEFSLAEDHLTAGIFLLGREIVARKKIDEVDRTQSPSDVAIVKGKWEFKGSQLFSPSTVNV